MHLIDHFRKTLINVRRPSTSSRRLYYKSLSFFVQTRSIRLIPLYYSVEVRDYLVSDGMTTIYDVIGGEQSIRNIVSEFYSRVEQNTTLRPLFPDSFDEVAERQFWFLSQLFGGPKLYMEHRGQPMLRMRHLRFRITEKHAQAWLMCMRDAVAAADISGPAAEAMLHRLHMTALHMVNTDQPE